MASDRFLRIATIGPIAARTLRHARRGHVVAVFERSAYLDFGGDLVCLGAPGIGDGALNAIVAPTHELRAMRVAAGATCECDARVLRIDDVVLDVSGARVWRPLPLLSPVDPERLAGGVATVRAVLAERAPPDGLAFLVTDAYACASLAELARPAADAFRTWVAGPDPAWPVPPTLAALIGLGPGLTPSGDDFLGAALIALRAFGEPATAQRLAAWLRPLRDRTHPVSAAHLAAACEGLGSEAVHACLHAIASGDDLRASIDRLGAIGHTSGWDALAGVLVVAEALMHRSTRGVAAAAEAQAPRSTRSASSAACAFDGATVTPAFSSVRTCRE